MKVGDDIIFYEDEPVRTSTSSSNSVPPSTSFSSNSAPSNPAPVAHAATAAASQSDAGPADIDQMVAGNTASNQSSNPKIAISQNYIKSRGKNKQQSSTLHCLWECIIVGAMATNPAAELERMHPHMHARYFDSYGGVVVAILFVRGQ